MLTKLDNVQIFASKDSETIIAVCDDKSIFFLRSLSTPCSFTTEKAFKAVEDWVKSKSELFKFDENWHANLRKDVILALVSYSGEDRSSISNAFCIFEQN